MRNHLDYPRAFGWAMALAACGLLLTATVLGADERATDTVAAVPEETTDLSTLPSEISDAALLPAEINDIGLEGQVLHSAPPVRPSQGASLPSAFVPRQTYPDGCGVSVSGIQGTCVGTNCTQWSMVNRLFRYGASNLGTCEQEGTNGCNTLFGGSNPNEAYHYTSTTPNAECNCIEIDFDTGSCGYYVHGVLWAGAITSTASFQCDDGLAGNPDWYYLADEGSSLPLVFSAELDPGLPTNSPGTYSVHGAGNYGMSQLGCTYSFSVTCRASESTTCALAPIETKIDELELGPTGKKRMLCHIPPGNPDNSHYINVGLPAVDPHVRLHGDCLAPGYSGKSGVKCTCP